MTLYSSMFQLDIPCPHRFFLGAQFPDLEDIDCNFSNQFEYEDLILYILENKNVQSKSQIDKIKKMAVRNIKKFSHSKKKDQKNIENYFDENYKPKNLEFALGYPIELFEVISRGIEKFSK